VFFGEVGVLSGGEPQPPRPESRWCLWCWGGGEEGWRLLRGCDGFARMRVLFCMHETPTKHFFSGAHVSSSSYGAHARVVCLYETPNKPITKPQM
jgi:hypothetical protein